MHVLIGNQEPVFSSEQAMALPEVRFTLVIATFCLG